MTQIRNTYQREPRRATLETSILKTGRDQQGIYAVTADTIFYPEGGGQPSDQGLLNGIRVLHVTRFPEEIRHYLEREVACGPARLELDWSRRFDHMQQHTAQHLLTAVAETTFGWRTTSFHLSRDVCDIELDVAEITPAELRRLEEKAVEMIRQARPVKVRWVSSDEYSELKVRTRGLPEGHQGEIRLVEIEGLDLCACGGTHLDTTAEIESVALPGTTGMRGGTRLFFVAGGRVRKRLAVHESRLSELRRVLETSDDELAQVAATRLNQLSLALKREKVLLQELAQSVSIELASEPALFLERHFADHQVSFLASVGRLLVERAPSKSALLTAAGSEGAFFVLATGPSSPLSASRHGPQVAAILEGRGGGTGALFQGKAGSLKRLPQAVRMLRQETVQDPSKA